MIEHDNAIFFDNTMISSYRECPRKYFFRHERGWAKTGTVAIELAFGAAWHSAMEAFWGGKSVRDSHVAFLQTWLEFGLPEPTPENYERINQIDDRRTPWIAMEMIENYARERKQFISMCTDIEIERPFAVPLGIEWRGKKVYYIGRLDKIVKHKLQGRLVIEHKTTAWYAKNGGFRTEFLEGFSPNSQVDGYIFSSNSLYENIQGVWIDAALCHKTVHDKFKFLPIDRQFAMLDDWLGDTKSWVQRIFADYDLINTNHSHPKNTSNCTMYMRDCVFKDICKYIANPRLSDTPHGYSVEQWQPFDVLKVEKIMGELK